MFFKVKDNEGNIYTNNMSPDADKWIIVIQFGTSYTQVIVQDKILNDQGEIIYPEKNIIIPLNELHWLDMIAVNSNEIGEWVVQ